MKSIKKRLSSIIVFALIALLSLALLFSVLIHDDANAETTTNTGETIGESGITFSEDGYTANIKTGGGTTYNVSSVSELVSAINNAAAGDIINVAAGTYNIDKTNGNGTGSNSAALMLTADGTQDAYITLKAADGAEGSVIFDFSTLAFDGNNRGVQVNGDYWYVYGIAVCGAGDNGLYVGGSYNVIEYCEFYNNRDTGLQLGRATSDFGKISQWPSYNLIKNCTSHNNYDNETRGENADGFAAKLTVGYGNVFDGCIAYRNSDDGWDLYAYADNGDIGAVIIYNCVAFENGYLEYTQATFNNLYSTFDTSTAEDNTNSYSTRDGDGNGFKLGGSVMRGNVKLYNCLAFGNRMHGVTDNSNPGVLNIEGVTSYNNGAAIDNDSSSDTFGQIIVNTVSDDYGNINTARSESSYNNYKNILSVADEYRSTKSEDGGLLEDEFLGSAQNCIFHMGDASHNYIGDAIDASTYETGASKIGTAISITAAETFETLPFTSEVKYYNANDEEVASDTEGATAKTVYTYNISGLQNTTIHSAYRNEDGSVNMGDILKIKDGCTAATLGVGANVSESSWDSYTHYYNVCVSSGASAEDATLIAIYNTLYLYCNTDAVYQDFTLTTSMTSATISWASSNEDVIKIGKSYNTSNSSSQDLDAYVYRPETDTQVTLTATITYNGVSCTKSFTVTVKADEPAIGEMYAEGVESGRILVDQYETVSEPDLIVTNAADYNGKSLADGTYSVETVYEYATGVTSTYSTVGAFTSSAAGVYRITKYVTLTASGDTETYTYYIYVASNSAMVDFTDSAGSVSVYSEGYIISGDLTNIKGTIYAYSTDTALDLTSYTTAAEQADYIKTLSGVESYSFTDSSITMYFTDSNDSAYTIYYWFENGNSVVTSNVHIQSVSLVEVSDTSGFESMLSAAASESNSTTIYLLTNDIDFSSSTPSGAGSKFYALLNGGGHTVSNISINTTTKNQGIIGDLYGGTIMNIRFLNYTISGGDGTALIGRSFGGYIYQVAMENVSITGSDRVAAIVGLDAANITYIDQVSVTGSITTSGNRAGGIIGHIQLNSSYTYVGAEISNCYVSADVIGSSTGTYIGGIVARFDDSTSVYSLSITNCYVTGTITCNYNYCGGMLGGQSGGAGTLTISGCAFLGTMVFKGTTLTEAQKNASGMIGRYSQYADTTVSDCFSVINEYYTGYSDYVSTGKGNAHYLSIWTGMNYDLSVYSTSTSSTWTFLDSTVEEQAAVGVSTRLQNAERYGYAPFIVLSFLITNDWDDVIISSSEAQRISTLVGFNIWSTIGYTKYDTTTSIAD